MSSSFLDQLLDQDLNDFSLLSNPQTQSIMSSSFLDQLLDQDFDNLSLSLTPQTPNVLQNLCSFSIHDSCAELPKQVRNMLHPAHLLDLSEKHKFTCDACVYDFNCSSYTCSPCGFNLCVECVVHNMFEEPRGHKKHDFKFWKASSFTCDVCGLDEVTNSRISCACTTCLLQAHYKCMSSSFPFAIKLPRHSHKLALTYAFQFNLSNADKICKICFRKMNNVLFMYSCGECVYVIHVGCGVSTTKFLEVDQLRELSRPSSSSSSLVLKETHQNDQIQHFSHPHSLSLINVVEPQGDNIICDGCVRPISAPFYACDECSFFLHRDCVELPKTIIHPLHAHELTLITAWDELSGSGQYKYDGSNFISGFKCDGCYALCNGFIYACKECSFYLDVGCSFLPDILHHEGHNCELTLIDTYARHQVKVWDHDDPKYKSNCNACGLSCVNKFVCEGCNFNLDLVCASLPQTIPHECPKHGWNKHPFKLKYHDIEDVSGVYFCDECEEKRSINHWYYYCEDCKYSAHPRCLLGQQRTKFGRSYEVKEHPHRVRLLKEPRLGWKHDCTTCMQPLEKFGDVLSCEECSNIYFHCYHDCCSLVWD